MAEDNKGGLDSNTIRYLNRVSRAPGIKKSIKRGMTRVKIDDVLRVDRNVVIKKYKDMLRPLIADEGLLNIMCSEQNIQKIKLRLAHNVTLRDSDNLVLGFVSDIGQYTILEIVEKLKRVLRKDMKVDEYLSELLNKYKLRYDHKRDGRLGKVKMDTIFRKG